MPLKFIEHDSKEYKQMIELRDIVLRQPLGLYFDPEELSREKDDLLIGAFEEDKLIGCCLLTRADNHTCRLRQMAVSSNVQKKGIGASMMSFAENVARDRGYNTLMMHARKSAVGFYEKFGYKVTSGEFYEVTIAHFVMEKKLR